MEALDSLDVSILLQAAEGFPTQVRNEEAAARLRMTGLIDAEGRPTRIGAALIQVTVARVNEALHGIAR